MFVRLKQSMKQLERLTRVHMLNVTVFMRSLFIILHYGLHLFRVLFR